MEVILYTVQFIIALIKNYYCYKDTYGALILNKIGKVKRIA